MRLRLFICLIFWSAAASAWSVLDSWADVVLTQIRAHQPLPILTSLDPALTLEDAFSIQRTVVRELTLQVPPVGFRADLTTPLGRAKLHSDRAITLAILKDQWLNNGATILRPASSKLRVAPALAFTLRQPVQRQLLRVSDAWAYIRDVRPAVLLLDDTAVGPGKLQLPDLVAANGGLARVVVGAPFARADSQSVDAIFLEMLRAGVVVDRAKATNVMGGQYAALRWLLNDLLVRGWTTQAGQLLVTGPLSEPVPAQVGSWLVDYRDQGKLEFTIGDSPRAAPNPLR
jgi:2-keto-4-pentenoate hydratase